jgi:hypothetical protein
MESATHCGSCDDDDWKYRLFCGDSSKSFSMGTAPSQQQQPLSTCRAQPRRDSLLSVPGATSEAATTTPAHNIRTDIHTSNTTTTTTPQGRVTGLVDHKRQANRSMNHGVQSALVERFAAATIYYATNGQTWTESTGWVTSADTCNWLGVTCDNNDVVTKLELGAYKMAAPSNGTKKLDPVQCMGTQIGVNLKSINRL